MSKATCRGDSCNFLTKHPEPNPETTTDPSTDGPVDTTATTATTETPATTTSGSPRLSHFGALLLALFIALLQ